MAVIKCVFGYNEKTGGVTTVLHLMEVCQHDQVFYVSADKGLTLVSQNDLPDGRGLRLGARARIKVEKKQVPAAKAPKAPKLPRFELYYHPTVQEFDCEYEGESVHGVDAPPPNPA